MCITEQKPNETALLRKAVDGLKQEIEKVKSVVYASKEVLNLEEAAMFLGISKSSLYKMTHNQVIPYFKPNNKMVYFEKSELLKWLRQKYRPEWQSCQAPQSIRKSWPPVSRW